mgnify:CR=1 FL=1
MPTDEILVKKIQQGDLQAFEILANRYQNRIYNMALRMLGVPEDAKDATQEIFVRTYRSLDKFRGDAKFSTWLYRLATNRCLDIVRIKNREGNCNVSLESDGIPVEKLADSAPSPEEVAARHDTRDRVRSAIKELPENYRMVLILYHYQGLSYREIANVLELSTNTVATHIARAKEKLRKKLLGGEDSALQTSKGKPGKVPGRRMFAP